MDRGAHAFVSYASDDAAVVGQLVEDLEALGIATWFDRRRLSPGVAWKEEIRDAIRGGAFFLACFSISAVARDRTFMREELAVAIEEMRMRSPRQSWFIPVRLDDCEIPDHPIGPAFSMRDVQWVDLSADWRKGVLGLASSIRPGREIANDIRRRVRRETATSEVKILLADVDAAVQCDPLHPDNLTLRGDVQFAAGLYLDAADDFGAAAALSQTSESFLSQAKSLWRGGQLDEAVAAAGRATRADPLSASAAHQFGLALYTVGDLRGALDQFRGATELLDLNDLSARCAARCLLHGQRGEELVELSDTWIARKEHPEFHEAKAFGVVLANNMTRLGADFSFELDSSLDWDEQLARWRERSLRAAQAMMEHRARSKTRAVEVAFHLDRAMALDPGNPRRMYRAAALYSQIYESDRCGELVEQALAMVPDSPALHLLMAYACEYAWDKTRMDECAAHFEAADGYSSDPLALEDPLPHFANADQGWPPPKQYRSLLPSIGGVVSGGTVF